MKEHLDLGRWPEADDLLDRALALPPEEREAFVRRATAHDRALGYALASIVREAGRDDGFLEPGGALTGDFGAEVGRALDLQPAAAHILTPGNSIEHYEVIELLGPQKKALDLARASVTERIVALEKYAERTIAADEALKAWETVQRLASNSDAYSDLLARTVRDELAIAEIDGLTEQAGRVEEALRNSVAKARRAGLALVPDLKEAS